MVPRFVRGRQEIGVGGGGRRLGRGVMTLWVGKEEGKMNDVGDHGLTRG